MLFFGLYEHSRGSPLVRDDGEMVTPRVCIARLQKFVHGGDEACCIVARDIVPGVDFHHPQPRIRGAQ